MAVREQHVESEPGTIAELRSMLKEFDTAMLSSVTPDGRIRSRPMAIQDLDERPNADLWFVTAIDSPKTNEIRGDEHVGVTCYHPGTRAYLSISALARIDRDPVEIRRLYQPDWSAWFDGPEDPRICILDLVIQRAEYWEPEGGRMRVLYEIVKARLTGEKADLHLNPPKHI